MQRYTVTIVDPGRQGQAPILAVPFQPNSIVSAFIDEIFKRVARQGLPLQSNTHLATLHLDSETGAIVDCEDVLGDVITDPKSEKLFAVFSKKQDASSQAATAINGASEQTATVQQEPADMLNIRVVTPSSIASPDKDVTLSIAKSATIGDLHKAIADKLGLPHAHADDDTNECNCNLARKLSEGASPPERFTVVHGKSNIKRFDLSHVNETSLKDALREHFGQDLEDRKKVVLVGAETHGTTYTYKKTPFVAVCSKNRHIPAHARAADPVAYGSTSRVLDLHASDVPIHTASYDTTIDDAGLDLLAKNGTVELYAVPRLKAATAGTGAMGKNAIFRAQPAWQPDPSPQSDRGIAMFLSTLRVWSSLVQDMEDDERAQDAILHTFDVLVTKGRFPPALRALHILINGKTPTSAESSALAHTVLEAIGGSMPTAIVSGNRSRLLEYSRLLFGFILEKARSLKLAEGATTLPYLSAFETVNLRDKITTEPVKDVVKTRGGLVERSLFKAFDQGGVLEESHLQTFMSRIDRDENECRVAMLSGGAFEDVLAFSASKLSANYQYPDAGNIESAIDMSELTDLHHLAELAARHKLAVHKPSQLASSVAPCLTYDRNAHLSVYVGQEACGAPGRSNLIFRPKHGEETIDTTIVEQLIAPILKTYEANGTSVFDSFGGAVTRRMQAPDEIIVVAIDTSASMRSASDLANDDDGGIPDSEELDVSALVENELYAKASFDEVQGFLNKYESLSDIVRTVAEVSEERKQPVAAKMLSLLRGVIGNEIKNKHKGLEESRGIGRGWYYGRRALAESEAALAKLKLIWAGLKTHEESALAFILFRASLIDSSALSQRWTWSLGDAVPSSTPAHRIPTPPIGITDVPADLRCPISHNLLEYATTAADGHVYDRESIERWFTLRKSSPMHGLPLEDTSLTPNTSVCDAVNGWIAGDGLVAKEEPAQKKPKPTDPTMEITFVSQYGSFSRRINGSTKINDLHRLAFRGLKAKYSHFQLAKDEIVIPFTNITAAANGLRDGDQIIIRIADDASLESSGRSSNATAQDMCLIKVFSSTWNMEFAFWEKRYTTLTMSAILFKYYRHRLGRGSAIYSTTPETIWVDMKHSGDGLMNGTVCRGNESLSSFLNARHCFGTLEAEKVYREDDRPRALNQPLVLKVDISAGKPMKSSGTLSRLDVQKQLFEGLINREIAYGYKNHIGLITIGSTSQVTMPITHVIENFRKATNDMKANGDTALWDGIALAQDQLKQYALQHPGALKRIICISDGHDTSSVSNTPYDLAWDLKRNGIVLDSICIGDEINEELRALSYILGSYRFKPESMAVALSIAELEPFLSSTERPAVNVISSFPRYRYLLPTFFERVEEVATWTKITEDIVPPRKEHPNIHDDFIQLKDMTRKGSTGAVTGGVTGARSNLRTTRIMTEMRQLVAGDHKQYDVYVSESDMTFWKVVLSGPPGSPYERGNYLLYLHAGDSYPTFSPEVRFVTAVRHPNINAHGRACVSLLSRDWTSDTRMSTVLDTIYGLLLQPEHLDHTNTATTLNYHHDEVEFAENVREHVLEHASRSRDTWKKIILGELEDDEDEVEESEEEEIDMDDMDDEMEEDEEGSDVYDGSDMDDDE